MSQYNNPFPNVPSASRVHRVSMCPSSHKMEQHAKDYSDKKDADKGNQVHDILAGEVNEDESPFDAAQTAEMCEEQAERLLAEWQSEGETPLGLKELRYGLTELGGVVRVDDQTKARIFFTGQFDSLYTQERKCDICEGSTLVKFEGKLIECPKCKGSGRLNHGLLIDFKALHGKHPSAIENPQLMSLAVLVAKKHKLASVRVALVQPWKGKPTTADLSAAGLELAESWLNVTLEAEMNATLEDRNAGDWCNHCAARFKCDVFINRNIEALDIIRPETLPANPDTRNKAIFARMEELTPHQLIHNEQYVIGMMGAFIAAHKVVLKARVEAGEIPGYTTREKKGRRSISDVGKVFAACASHGVTADAFTAECSIGLGSVKELLKNATHAKGRALDKLSDEVLTGCVETGKGSLEIVKVGQLE
jgi:hypothetical protein